MNDAWETLLRATEWSVPAIRASHTQDWPEGTIEHFERLGLLWESGTLSSLRCKWCDEIGWVNWRNDPFRGEACPYFLCTDCGPVRVRREQLRVWSVDLPALTALIATVLEVRGRCREMIPDCLWQLGKVAWTTSPTTVFVGRGLHRRDDSGVFERVAEQPNTLIFATHQLPQTGTPAPVLALDLVSHWKEGELLIDREYLGGQLRFNLDWRPSPPKIRKRASRTALIECLTRELAEHVRAARDHAYETLERNGQAALLPRPTRRDLAQRCDAQELAVGRCLRDDSARELRFLWDLADDLDRLLDGGVARE